MTTDHTPPRDDYTRHRDEARRQLAEAAEFHPGHTGQALAISLAQVHATLAVAAAEHDEVITLAEYMPDVEPLQEPATVVYVQETLAPDGTSYRALFDLAVAELALLSGVHEDLVRARLRAHPAVTHG